MNIRTKGAILLLASTFLTSPVWAASREDNAAEKIVGRGNRRTNRRARRATSHHQKTRHKGDRPP